MKIWLPLFKNRRSRRLVLVAAVRDEADVLDANLRHHFALGVDFAVMADNGSTDGTCEILEAWQQRGMVAWVAEPDESYRQSEWITRLALSARERHGADWILADDADEFWCPHEGDLKDFIATERGAVLRCGRRNQVRVVAPGEDPKVEFLHKAFAEVRAPRAWREPCAERGKRELSDPTVPGVTWHGEEPKVLARADVVGALTQGGHRVQSRDWVWATEPAGLTIRHFPIRSAEQFVRKVTAGGAAYARSGLPAAMGWHWRYWQAEAAAGRVTEAYARETVRAGATPWPAALGPGRTAAEALDRG